MRRRLGFTLASLLLPRRPPRPLLNNGLLALLKDGLLSLVHSLNPVAEAGADGGEDGVAPEGMLAEDGSSLDAQLPGAGGQAYKRRKLKGRLATMNV